jgi:hypothetical protein
MTTPLVVTKAFADVTPTEAPAGAFRARVAVFDVIDRAGDVIRPGAFTESLKTWRRSTKAMPIIWSHQHGDVKAVLGKVVHAHEDATGLVVDGVFELQYPEAERAYSLLKSGTVTDWSYAALVTKTAHGRVQGQAVRDILAAHVLEIGPCVIGMNEHTALLALKGAVALGYPCPPDPHVETYRRRVRYWSVVTTERMRPNG